MEATLFFSKISGELPVDFRMYDANYVMRHLSGYGNTSDYVPGELNNLLYSDWCPWLINIQLIN